MVLKGIKNHGNFLFGVPVSFSPTIKAFLNVCTNFFSGGGQNRRQRGKSSQFFIWEDRAPSCFTNDAAFTNIYVLQFSFTTRVVPRAQTCGAALSYSPWKNKHLKLQLLLFQFHHSGLVVRSPVHKLMNMRLIMAVVHIFFFHLLLLFFLFPVFFSSLLSFFFLPFFYLLLVFIKLFLTTPGIARVPDLYMQKPPVTLTEHSHLR